MEDPVIESNPISPVSNSSENLQLVFPVGLHTHTASIQNIPMSDSKMKILENKANEASSKIDIERLFDKSKIAKPSAKRGQSTSPIYVKNKLLWLDVVKRTYGVEQARLFEEEVRNYCTQRKINPNHLMSLMALETSGSFKTKQPNKESERAKVWPNFNINGQYLDELMKTKNGWPEEIIPRGTYKKGYPYAFGLIQFKSIAAKEIGTTLRTIYYAKLNQ